jgi:hypothetical protein
MKPKSELILYQTEDNRTRIEVRLENETVWLTQKLMAKLFQKDVRTVNEHIQNIFDEGELSPDSVIRKFRITAADGKAYDTQHYNLDVIIAVGYRVKSHRGTQFRQCANYPGIPDNCRRRQNLRISYQGTLDNCRRWQIKPSKRKK